MSVELEYTVDGPRNAPVVVLGSSIGTTAKMWQSQIPALSRRFRVVRYDHRGHGGSPVTSAPYHLDDLGHDVLALLDNLGLKRVHLGGLSLGGMVAMWVAANYPERVDRLALVCTSALLGPPEMWISRIESVEAGGMEAIADTTMGRWFTEEFARRQPRTVAWARKMLTNTPVEGYVGCAYAIRRMDLIADLNSITAPTLVIAATDDPSTPPEHAWRIASGILESRLEIVPDAAHLANVEQPKTVTRLLNDFLGGNDDRA